jgi:hypothetical protein
LPFAYSSGESSFLYLLIREKEQKCGYFFDLDLHVHD